MIKNDPQRMAIRRSTRIFFVLFIVMLAISIFSFILTSSSGQRFAFPLFYLFPLILIIVAFALSSVVFRKVDKRRTLALQGDQSMLAVEQPVPNANSLPFPLTIELRPATSYFKFFFGLVIIGGFTGGLIAYFSDPTRNHTGHHASLIVLIIVIAIILAVFILLIALFVFLLRRQMRYQIKVDEQGIEVRYNRITTRVNWNEARQKTA